MSVFKNLILRFFFIFCGILHNVRILLSFAPVIANFRRALDQVSEEDLQDPLCQLVIQGVEAFEKRYDP
jgi:hypothetical protein